MTPFNAARNRKVNSAGEALDRRCAFDLRVPVSEMIFICEYIVTCGHNIGHDKSTAEIDPGGGAIIPSLSYQFKEVEQFTIGQVNLAFGARFAVNS